eukprot:TRINITY_DN67759_c5_g9_i1.p2 TRINITY_DN67759_c5_g9~~TRINITY_DN67759_c5_g9_i1.p2  ORF type:complete len:133 (-),score=17.49 TRINITY_DN67759_c5_g9_i1:81-479(-)
MFQKKSPQNTTRQRRATNRQHINIQHRLLNNSRIMIRALLSSAPPLHQSSVIFPAVAPRMAAANTTAGTPKGNAQNQNKSDEEVTDCSGSGGSGFSGEPQSSSAATIQNGKVTNIQLTIAANTHGRKNVSLN